MTNEIKKAVIQICEEKGLTEADVIGTIEAALAAAYRKDFAKKEQNIRVTFNLDKGESEVFDVKDVVDDVPEEELTDNESLPQASIEPGLNEDGEEIRRFNPKTDIQISEAIKIDKSLSVGDVLKRRLTVPDSYGRMAAQTAKQVIIQKLREAERETQYNDFLGKEHTVTTGTVQRRDGWNVLVDVDRSTARMPKDEQIDRENYKTGDRIKVYIKSVTQTNRGPEIIVSRINEEIVKSVFENEIPEVGNGVIEIKAIAREAGARSKVAVFTNDSNIDPIGSCVGQRGTRVQTIISELGGEKIDIIEYEVNPEKYITNALAPAELISVTLDEEKRTALVTVANEQLSLAIGRAGQNVRLASKLTGWRIDIKSEAGELVDTEVDAETHTENIVDASNDINNKVSSATDTPDIALSKEETKKLGEVKQIKETDSETKKEEGLEDK